MNVTQMWKRNYDGQKLNHTSYASGKWSIAQRECDLKMGKTPCEIK